MKRGRAYPRPPGTINRPLAAEPEDAIEDGPEDAADDRADDRDPAVPPVRSSLAGNRQDGVGDTRAQVSGRVDGVARGPAERKTDSENEQTDEKREEAAPGDLSTSGCEGGHDGDHAEDQHGCADDLSDEVGNRVADRRGSGEHAQLEPRVRGLLPVREVGQPDEDGADEGPEELGDDEARDLGPWEQPYGSKADRDGRVDEGAADPTDRVDGHRHSHTPPEGDHDPTGVLRFGVPQEHAGDNPVTENDEDHRADELSQVLLHPCLLSRT